jgi:hypothetical protein
MERHVKPFKLQRLVGRMHVSCWESRRHPDHLFELSKMFHGGLHHWFLEDVVFAGLHIDILPIPRLFLVQRLLNKELNCSMEVFFQTAILHSWYWHSCIDGLPKVLVKHLFPGRFVVALEHILKLPKRVCPVKVTFFCSLVELRDGFINGKFNTIFTVILVDLDSTFVT